MVAAEVRHLADAYDALDLPDWSVMSGDNYLTSSYNTGAFIISAENERLPAAYLALDSAASDFEGGVWSTALEQAIDGFDAMAILYDSTVHTSLYGVPQRYVDAPENTISEGIYGLGDSDDLGKLIARSISQQIGRISEDPGVPAAAVSTLATVKERLELFEEAVRQRDEEPGFSNYDAFVSIYIPAYDAVAELRMIQGSGLYSYNWRTGLAITTGLVANYSLFDGPKALATIAPGE